LVSFKTAPLSSPFINEGASRGGLGEYQLEKWQRTCAYCGKQDVPLQIEHITPKSRGGSNRLSNLTIACKTCNQAKGSQSIEGFLAKKPDILQKILAQAKRPLHDAAAVNTTRWALARALEHTGLPLALASGGKTKFNRCQQGIPKTHALDAVCVGNSGPVLHWSRPTLEIRCTGRGCYQRTLSNAFGFPRGYCMRAKLVDGFQTGDMVKAVVTKGKKIGTYVGRVAVRASGNFNIRTKAGLVVQGIASKYCTLLSRNDGYGYAQRPKIAIT